ncbi:MAG: MBL fold metallo-hydrolase [Pseudomonadota bacterium]
MPPTSRSATVASWGEDARALGDHVTLLAGADDGRYPSGNSLLVQGSSDTLIIDPSVTVVARGGAPRPIDVVVNSHAHEDHIAGNGLFEQARVCIHADDLPGITSLDGLMNIYGLSDPGAETRWREEVVEDFHFTPRPDATGFSDGHRFDVGGVQVEAVHLPGHTRGHSGFRIGDDVFYLSDIDLTGFGPYYGDVWSDLDDFEESLIKVRDEDARFYVTFHHKGVIEGREAFLAALDGYAAVIPRRHQAMLEFLETPHSLDDMVAHRFIYRPHVESTFVNDVERRSAELHLARMLKRGEAEQTDDGRLIRRTQ